MLVASTLSRYIARVFSMAVLAMLAGLSLLVSLFDFIELLRRSATRPEATFGLVSEIAGLRLPWISMQILPFAVLLGGIYAFWRLTRSSELIVARAAGVSAWQFLAAPTLCAIALGAFATGGLSPISAVMRARAEALDNAYLRSGGGPLALNGGQLWLRQADHEREPEGPRPERARCQRVPAGRSGPAHRAHRGEVRQTGQQHMAVGRRPYHDAGARA
jgi:lipopolysaccharide export system permease protein